jgi:hypothetical protein
MAQINAYDRNSLANNAAFQPPTIATAKKSLVRKVDL